MLFLIKVDFFNYKAFAEKIFQIEQKIKDPSMSLSKIKLVELLR